MTHSIRTTTKVPLANFKARASFIAAVEKGLDDADAGRLTEQAELAAEMATRYGKH